MEKNLFTGKNIIIVDDEADIREIIASEFNFLGANVFEADNISAAQKLWDKHSFDLIISDIRMPGGTGIELLDLIKKKKSDVPFILITGFADITLEDALHKGAEALLNKPFRLDDLIKTSLRLMSPFDDRFHEKISINKEVNTTLDAESFRFGRGGAVLKIRPDGLHLDSGDFIKFDFTLDKGHFRGEGICKWVKFDNKGPTTLVGLEFMNLESPSLSIFKKIYQGHSLIPYIPRTVS